MNTATTKYTVMTGDFASGIALTGIFDTYEQAQAYGNRYCYQFEVNEIAPNYDDSEESEGAH